MKKNINRIKWLAGFDMEPLLSSIFLYGTILSVLLISSALVIHLRNGGMPINLGVSFHARSIPQLLINDLNRFERPHFWPQFLLHLGFSILLLTPYFRLVASMVYFGWIEKSWKHAAFTGFVLVLLMIGLFTTFI